MIDFITHYYKIGSPPFRSLSALPEKEAVRIMESLCDETVFGARFKDPLGYLRRRRKTEHWVREQFVARGGQPQDPYPVYFVLGSSKWILNNAEIPDPPQVRIPLSAFSEWDISFTYPDSMISLWFATDRPEEYYLAEFHGKVFTRSEILAIVAELGMPEECWQTRLPAGLAPYIEAQVWNQRPLVEFLENLALRSS
jgi:hypothetical protein